ncbi:30S ribosomal protein S6 [Patescibacteria group bacterium]
MTKYELLYIIPSQYTDAEIEGIMAKIAALVEQVGGKILRNENLGKIKLAYTINRVQHGSYILIIFESEGSIIDDLNQRLKLTDEVLRHILLIAPAKAEEKKYELTAYVAPLTDQVRRERSAPARPRPKLPPPTPAKLDEASPSLSMEELDKKLDEILDDNEISEKA